MHKWMPLVIWMAQMISNSKQPNSVWPPRKKLMWTESKWHGRDGSLK